MMRRKEVLFSILVLLAASFISAFEFSVVNQGDFDQGDYTATEFNTTGTYLQLSLGNIAGNYTSKVFDGDDLSQWQTLATNTTLVTEPSLIVVDAKDDVWQSRDGVAWLLVRDDYNSGDGGGDDSQFAFADHNNTLYSIEDDDDVWTSFDQGMNWTKVNDDYNNEGQHVERAVANYNNHLYLIEGDEDVWQSTDGGVNWTKTNGSDFNGGNGDVKGMVVNSSNAMFVVDANEDVWISGDGIAWKLIADDLNGGETSDASYLSIDTNNFLYALEDDDDIWQSTNSGLNWTKINDDYNGENDHVVRSIFDYQNSFYLIEGDEDAWRSLDFGLNWTKTNGSDFNGGNGDPVGLMALNVTTNVTMFARSCVQSDCSDGTFTATGEILTVGNARYFQFLLTLTADANDMTPQFFNVSLTYNDVGAPSINGVAPSTGNFTANTTVEINATVADGKYIDTVAANLTLPNGTATLLPLTNTTSSFYAASYVALDVGNYAFTLLANDTSNNLNDSSSGAFTVSSNNPGSGGGGSNSQNSISGNAVQGDSGPDALRNAPPGTPVISSQPQPRLPTPSPSSPSPGTPTTQQPSGPSDSNPLTGAAVGQQEGGLSFKTISLTLLILAFVFFVASYILRERRLATKHLYMRKRPHALMVKHPEVLDKLQGYVSAEILHKLKKGDALQQQRIDPQDKEFAHHFPETAKELQQQKIHVHSKRFTYERLEQVKRDISKGNNVISASDMKKLFPETLGKTSSLHHEAFVLTPHGKEMSKKVAADDFSTYYTVKAPEKTAPEPKKQMPQTSRKINKTSKERLLQGLQEVYKLE